jgi:hypothetical protein
MFETERAINAQMTRLQDRLLVGLPDDRLAEQPVPGINHAAWQLGHLIISYDFAAACAGLDMAYRRWLPKYGPGSTPAPDRAAYPPLAEFLDKLRTSHERALAALPNVTPEQLAVPNTIDLLLPHLATRGLVLSHLLTSHLTYHLGQLSVWRKAMGLTTNSNGV